MTGGRLRRVGHLLRDSGTFCFTYGDASPTSTSGALIAHHRALGKMATLTAVQPPGRYGALDIAPTPP